MKLLLVYIVTHACTIYFPVNKQINDKERVAAALENPNLLRAVEECLEERDV